MVKLLATSPQPKASGKVTPFLHICSFFVQKVCQLLFTKKPEISKSQESQYAGATL